MAGATDTVPGERENHKSHHLWCNPDKGINTSAATKCRLNIAVAPHG